MPPVAHRWACVALAASFIVAACGGDDSHVRVSTGSRDRSDATFSKRDTNRTLGPGDVRIVNSDASFELAIIGDSIVTGFGPKVLAEIKKGTDTASVTSQGMGASIEKFVKSTVADAMNHEIKYAVADVKSVQYTGSKLEFFWKDGSKMRLLESTKDKDKPVSQTFAAADANRFVAAFDAKKAALGR